jgi:aminomethyltransferase
VTKLTPLAGEHERLGATSIEFAGWNMPIRYSSDLAEHRCVRTAAGLFDLSHMGEFEVTGPDAAALLDHALVSTLSKVKIGRAKYSLLCDADGGILDDLVVYRLAEQRFLAVVNASNTEHDLTVLTERADGFDAEVADRSADTALIAVQGPASPNIVGALGDRAGADLAELIAGLRYYTATETELAGHAVVLARTGYTGEDGFEIYLSAAEAPALWRTILAEGEPHGLRPAGLACRDTLRLEAGMALYGNDIHASTNPYAAGLGRVVALDKDFVGRDALARLAERPPERVLVGLTGSGRRAARAGCPITDSGGREVGTVTSGVLSPTLGKPIALAHLDAGLAEPGQALAVDVRGTLAPYSVTPPPFYRR